MDEAYRSPNANERAVLQKLLEKVSSGRDALLAQLDGLSVKVTDAEGSLSLRPNPSAARALVKDRVVSEAYYSDQDACVREGPLVNVLMHVVEGFLAELEIYKDDGSPIKKDPRAEDLTFY